MRNMKWIAAVSFALLTTASFAVTADDATSVHPKRALMHDIIKVSADDIAKYCHFDRQIVELPVDKHGKQMYLCVAIGETRNTVK